jgi:hypothetical protein
MELTTSQRRRFQKLTDEIDRLLDTDRRFFERRPDRSYRLRRAFRQEIEAAAFMGHALTDLPKGKAYFVLIHKITSAVLIRVFLVGSTDNETDVPDTWLQALFEQRVSEEPRLGQIEGMIERTFRNGRPCR